MQGWVNEEFLHFSTPFYSLKLQIRRLLIFLNVNANCTYLFKISKISAHKFFYFMVYDIVETLMVEEINKFSISIGSYQYVF